MCAALKGFHVGDAHVKKLTPASKMCGQSPLGVMLNFDVRVKNSDAAQPRVTNVKTPLRAVTNWDLWLQHVGGYTCDVRRSISGWRSVSPFLEFEKYIKFF